MQRDLQEKPKALLAGGEQRARPQSSPAELASSRRTLGQAARHRGAQDPGRCGRPRHHKLPSPECVPPRRDRRPRLPAGGARTVLGRSSGAQHPRLSPESASPCAPASPVRGCVLHPRKEGVRYCHQIPLRTWHQSRQGLFNARELLGEGRWGGSSLGLALRLESRARRLYQVECGMNGEREPGEGEDRGSRNRL